MMRWCIRASVQWPTTGSHSPAVRGAERWEPLQGSAKPALSRSGTAVLKLRGKRSAILDILEPALGRLDDGVGRPYRCISPIFEVGQQLGDPGFDRHLRAPTDLGSDARRVGKGAVRLSRSLWNVPDLRRADQFDETADADGRAAADIVHSTAATALGGRDKGMYHVGDKGKIARLRAVSDDGQGLSGELLGEEDTEHRPVSAAGARPRSVYVEQPQRGHRNPVDLSPVQYGLLAEILRQRIGIAWIDRRGFRCWVDLRDAIA